MKNIIVEPKGVDFVIGPSKMTKKDFQEISAYITKHKSEQLKSSTKDKKTVKSNKGN